MCYAIYGALIFLSAYYSYDLLEGYALAVADGAGNWMAVALGSEILFTLWPLLILAMILASAITFFLTRAFVRAR